MPTIRYHVIITLTLLIAATACGLHPVANLSNQTPPANTLVNNNAASSTPTQPAMLQPTNTGAPSGTPMAPQVLVKRYPSPDGLSDVQMYATRVVDPTNPKFDLTIRYNSKDLEVMYSVQPWTFTSHFVEWLDSDRFLVGAEGIYDTQTNSWADIRSLVEEQAHGKESAEVTVASWALSPDKRTLALDLRLNTTQQVEVINLNSQAITVVYKGSMQAISPEAIRTPVLWNKNGFLLFTKVDATNVGVGIWDGTTTKDLLPDAILLGYNKSADLLAVLQKDPKDESRRLAIMGVTNKHLTVGPSMDGGMVYWSSDGTRIAVYEPSKAKITVWRLLDRGTALEPVTTIGLDRSTYITDVTFVDHDETVQYRTWGYQLGQGALIPIIDWVTFQH